MKSIEIIQWTIIILGCFAIVETIYFSHRGKF